MSLIKSNSPWLDLTDFFDEKLLPTRFANGEWSPAINVSDNDGKYEIEVAAPGIKKEDFKVAIENGVLTISGESEEEREEKKKNYTRKEFSSRSFTRSFTLPEDVKEESVQAHYENGVLKLNIQKEKNIHSKKKEIAIS